MPRGSPSGTPDVRRLAQLHADFCQAFTHPTRLAILDLLRKGERSVGDLVKATGQSQPSVSKHLAAMRHWGVVVDRRAGTQVYYRLRDERLMRAFDLIRDVLVEYLGSLGKVATSQPR